MAQHTGLPYEARELATEVRITVLSRVGRYYVVFCEHYADGTKSMPMAGMWCWRREGAPVLEEVRDFLPARVQRALRAAIAKAEGGAA